MQSRGSSARVGLAAVVRRRGWFGASSGFWMAAVLERLIVAERIKLPET